MRFGPLPLDEAGGKVLAHNVSDGEGRRVLRKGRVLDPPSLDTLRSLGHAEVYVAELEEGDVHEDEAAARIAAALIGEGVEAAAPHTGRVNVKAMGIGVLTVDEAVLQRVNRIRGVAAATLLDGSLVRPGDRVATVKIVPYALPHEAVEKAEAAPGATPGVTLNRISPVTVATVLVGDPGAWSRLDDGLGRAIRGRVEALECSASPPSHAELSETDIARALTEQIAEGIGLVVIAGETAIMDENDLIPRGIVRAGGRIEHLGLPMDPGQLLLLAYYEGVPVVGAPGCVRGKSPDGFDAVVSRLLSGSRLARKDLQKLGHGGLLADPRKRP